MHNKINLNDIKYFSCLHLLKKINKEPREEIINIINEDNLILSSLIHPAYLDKDALKYVYSYYDNMEEIVDKVSFLINIEFCNTVFDAVDYICKLFKSLKDFDETDFKDIILHNILNELNYKGMLCGHLIPLKIDNLKKSECKNITKLLYEIGNLNHNVDDEYIINKYSGLDFKKKYMIL